MPFEIPNESTAAFPDQAEPDAIDFAILVAALKGDYVVSGCLVTAQGTPDMTVAVASGVVRINGVSVAVSAGNVTIAAADATNPRFDLIAIDDAGVKSRVAGTASSNPVFPSIPANSIIIASVYVPANDTDIDANQIIDKRVIVPQSSILVDFSTETLNDDGAEHTFTKTLVLPAGGWEVDFLMQPILADGEDENGYVYWGIVYDNPDAIVFATEGNIQTPQLMMRNLGDPLGNWGDVSVSNLYCRMRVKDSIEQSQDNVAMIHFNVYCTVPTTFTVSYEVAPQPTPPYTPVLYPGFAYMRATSLGS